MKSILQRLISERKRVSLRYAFYKFTAPMYYGTARSCNLCHKSYKAFLPFGIVKIREDACCPGCRSLERTRLLAFYLEREILLQAKVLKVLHFAPEPQITELLLKYSSVRYLSVDINPELAMQKEDIHALSFPENSFDLLLNSHVLSVLPDDRKALKEMYRVLKPGGLLILQEEMNFQQPTTPEVSPNASTAERIHTFHRDDLYRDYGMDLIHRVQDTGFEVVYLDYANQLGLEVKNLYGLNDGQGLLLCYKK